MFFGSFASVTVGTSHITLRHFILKNLQGKATLYYNPYLGKFVRRLSVIKLQYQYVGFPTINTRMYLKVVANIIVEFLNMPIIISACLFSVVFKII